MRAEAYLKMRMKVVFGDGGRVVLFTCLRLLFFTRRGSAASGAESAAEKLLREKETAWAEDAARMREDSHAKVSGGRGGSKCASDTDSE